MDTWFRKNRMLALAVFSIVLAYVCYVFSFAKTIEAIALNRSLATKASDVGVWSSSVDNLMAERAKVHEDILKRYRVHSTDREGRLWKNISSLAMASGVEISLQPGKKEVDTNLIASGIWRQELLFSGRIDKVFGFLDTVHKAIGIGRIHSMKVFVAPESETEVSMKLVLMGREN